jgi:hypothetical protein
MSDVQKDEVYAYLFRLQESGATNMFGSGTYVQGEFPELSRGEVRTVVTDWMSNYSEIAERLGYAE